MGYNLTASTITLTAKLTPVGRNKLIASNTSLITSFSFGDSDANYYAANPLTTGEVPTSAGNIGANGLTSNSVGPNTTLKSFLLVNSNGQLKKAVESQSSLITNDFLPNGVKSITGSGLTINVIDRNNLNTDPLVNLFYSFNLPLTSSDDYNFTTLTSNYGGFADTALSAVGQTKIIAIAIDNNKYGEIIDGKSIKLDITTTAASYTLYGTYQNNGLPLSVQDANYSDYSVNTQVFGSNVAYLVCDSIKKPNGNTSLSWATGYGTTKPFSLNGKQLYNFKTDSNLSQTADTIVGVAYLDKGFMVITHPTIVSAYTTSTATTISCDSLSTSIMQNITCIANRGEFGYSTNPTFRPNDIPRISEVGLYDADNNLIAIAKTDRHLVKGINEFLAIGVKISL